MKTRFMRSGLMLLGLIFSGWSQGTFWQTTREGNSQGICRLVNNSITVKISTHSVDVEEEAEIQTEGNVWWGDPNSLEIVGQFQLPTGVAVRSMLLWWKDDILKAKLRDRRSADSLYEKVVDRQQVVVPRDPALIEYAGNGSYDFKIYPVAIGKSRKIRILYTVPLTPGLNQFEFDFRPVFLQGFSNNHNQSVTSIPVKFINQDSTESKYIWSSGKKPRNIEFNSTYLWTVDPALDYWGNIISVPHFKILPSTPPRGAFTFIEEKAGQITHYTQVYSHIPETISRQIEKLSLRNYTIEARISNGEEVYLVEVAPKGLVMINNKSEKIWDHHIIWKIYNNQGAEVFKDVQEYEKNIGGAKFENFAMLWGARYTLKEGKGNLGALYGFVDRDMSLLALEADALPANDRDIFAVGGVPILTPSEIIVGPNGLPVTPKNNIIIQIPSTKTLTLSQLIAACNFLGLKGDLLSFSLPNGISAVGFELYDITGKIVVSHKSMRVENGQIQIPSNRVLKGSYIAVFTTSEGQKLQVKLRL